MLVFEIDVRTIELHRDKGGGLCHAFVGFDPADPLPWWCPIDLKHCECLGEATEAERAGELAKAVEKLGVGYRAWVAHRVGQGARVLKESEVLERAKGVFGATTLQELRKAGRFPEPVAVNGRNLWLEEEAMLGIAKFVAGDMTKPWERERPRNRHEGKRKA